MKNNEGANPEPGYSEEDAPALRRIIAQRMTESKASNPHFYLTVDVDVEPLVEYREQWMAKHGEKVAYNSILMKAIANNLVRHPESHVAYIDDKVRTYQDANICLAVAVKNGLLTPVVRACQDKSVAAIDEEARALIDKARKMRLRPRESAGGTFTLSNLGMFGIEQFSAIINPPQAMIMAVGSMREVPVVENGEIVIGKRMKLTLSCDHKAIDGATGALFLSDLASAIEDAGAIEEL